MKVIFGAPPTARPQAASLKNPLPAQAALTNSHNLPGAPTPWPLQGPTRPGSPVPPRPRPAGEWPGQGRGGGRRWQARGRSGQPSPAHPTQRRVCRSQSPAGVPWPRSAPPQFSCRGSFALFRPVLPLSRCPGTPGLHSCWPPSPQHSLVRVTIAPGRKGRCGQLGMLPKVPRPLGPQPE